jgi:hypothetical protein
MIQASTSPKTAAAMTALRPLERIGDLLTTTQAAARCGITERSLSTYWRAGGKVFVAEQALADWLAARTERQPPANPLPMPPAASAAAA